MTAPAVVNPALASRLNTGPFTTMPGAQILHLPEWAYEMAWQPYDYQVDYLPLAANKQGASQPIQVESNMVFVIMAGSMEVLDVNNANPQTWPLLRCSIQQGGSGRSFMPANVFVPVINKFGIGKQIPWTTPAIIPAQGSWQTILNNLTATAWNVSLTYHGIALLL